MGLVKELLIRREMEERRAFDRIGIGCYKPLKLIDFLSLINCQLNGI